MLHTRKRVDLSRSLCLVILTFINEHSGLMQGLMKKLKAQRAVYVQAAAKNGSQVVNVMMDCQ